MVKIHNSKIGKRFEDLRIAVIASDNGACGNYRVIIPYNNLINKGFNQFKIFNNIPPLNILKYYDVILFQRITDYNAMPMFPPYYVGLNIMKELKSMGKIIIHEVDDNLLIIPAHNPCYIDYKPNSEAIKIHKEALRIADYIHCTTPKLRDSIGDMLNIDKKRIYSFDNAIDINSKYYVNGRNKLPQDKIIIGYQGGSSHEKDLKLIVEPVKEILRKNDNVMFAFCSNPYFLKHFNIPADRLINIPLQENFNLFLTIPSMFDIGLVPLLDDEFNRNKSSLKLLEYGAYRVPTVCSKMKVYDKGLEINLLASDKPKDWIKNIQLLIDDENLRRKIGDNVHLYSTALYSSSAIDIINDNRLDFYRSLCVYI